MPLGCLLVGLQVRLETSVFGEMYLIVSVYSIVPLLMVSSTCERVDRTAAAPGGGVYGQVGMSKDLMWQVVDHRLRTRSNVSL